jgi:hypothetical protein
MHRTLRLSLQFIRGFGGDLSVRFEEGTWAAWLYDLLKPDVTRIVVCDPRRNAGIAMGQESRIEPWLPLTTVLYVSFRADWLHREGRWKPLERKLKLLGCRIEFSI